MIFDAAARMVDLRVYREMQDTRQSYRVAVGHAAAIFKRALEVALVVLHLK